MTGSIPDGRKQPLAIALAAARRWKSREPERKDKIAAIKDGRLTDADTPERLAKRMERLHGLGPRRRTRPAGRRAA